MMGHMSYILRRIVKQHCQLNLHYMLPESVTESVTSSFVVDNFIYVNKND